MCHLGRGAMRWRIKIRIVWLAGNLLLLLKIIERGIFPRIVDLDQVVIMMKQLKNRNPQKENCLKSSYSANCQITSIGYRSTF